MLEQVLDLLAKLPGTKVTRASRVYLSTAVGGPKQPDYLNQVIEIETQLAPRTLLAETQRIEGDLGRRRTVRWGPRNIDIDILWYDGFSATDDDLQVPHPRMGERRFVLEPLAEIAPGLVLPGGKTVQEALALVGDQDVRPLPPENEAGNPSGLGEGRRQSVPRSCGQSIDYSSIQAEIRELAQQKQAVILAHNYQRPEVQDVADILGDSLWLSQRAAASQAQMIVFCGVHFMAETAAILAPERPVIMPEPRAGCPMADMIDVPGLETLKARHPGAIVVSYVNTTAAIKAISDICCTSSNAVRVVSGIEPGKEIIFTPDVNLGAWVAKKTGRDLILWPGFCPTHQLIEVADIQRARKEHPHAKVVVHPECRPEVSAIADAVESTSGMIRFCREDDAEEYLIGTELGMIYRLCSDIPDKRFYPVTEASVCPNMKLTTLEKLRDALVNEAPVITVEAEVAEKARHAVRRMIEVSP